MNLLALTQSIYYKCKYCICEIVFVDNCNDKGGYKLKKCSNHNRLEDNL